MIKSYLSSVVKKLVVWDKKLEIYTNGEDNAYSERMENFKNNSVTASMASNIMTQYLIGKGFGEADNFVIGSDILIDFADDIAQDLVDHRGLAVHVSYDMQMDPCGFKYIPFNNVRVGEKDSQEYNGKFLICKNWSEKANKSNIQVLDTFNIDKKIIAYQIEKAGGFEKFKGQIIFFNMDNKYYYPLSRIHAVSKECENEYQASVYKNELLTRGFFGKTLVVTRPLSDPLPNNPTDYQLEENRNAESEREDFKKSMSDFIGAGNAGGVLHLEMDFAGEKLDDAILFKNIESNIDDKLFSFTENSALEKILMAYNNLPISLVKSPDSAMLGNSGEALRVAKETYWENTSKERNIIETLINNLLKIHRDFKESYQYITVTPLITKKIEAETPKII